jgi:peptidyl-tRNA hydrolase, PTH1 family
MPKAAGGVSACGENDMAGEPLKLIVGLGNPGTEYARTRHNAGFQLLDELARRHGAVFRSEPRHRAELARARLGEAELWLLKPMSYMNRSGEPVRSVASFYKVPLESILVAYDELDFPPGVVRLKQGGGAAGHNGMRDVITQVGDAFWRLRIGIGHPGDRAQVLEYVLGRPSAADAALIHEALLAAADAVPVLLGEGAQIAMNRLHSRDPVPGPPANS